jgi:hypothetical protein
MEQTEIDEIVESALHDETSREKAERFRIENDGQATWAMKKLRTVLKQQKEQLTIAEHEMALIQQWIDDVKRRNEWTVRYFENLLGDYARRQREQGVKTVTTPYGKVATRMSDVKIACSNPEEFIAWASENLPDGVRIKKEVAVSALKELIKSGALNAIYESQQLLTENGEVIPAINVVPPQVAVSISTEE